MGHNIVLPPSHQGLIHLTRQNVLRLWMLPASRYISLPLRWSVCVWEQPVCFWSFSLVLTLLAHAACRRWPWACHVWTKTTVFAISAPLFHIPVCMPLAPVLSKSGVLPISMPVISRPAIHLFTACWRGTRQLNNYSLGRGKREQKPVDCDSIMC